MAKDTEVKEHFKNLLQNNIAILLGGKSFNFDHKLIKVDSF